MSNLRHALPRLDRLVAFEAAARLGSFTRAADELHRTQSAISHAVKALEEELGTPLFERMHRAIRLTPEGTALHNSVATALNHLGAATRTLRTGRSLSTLRLVTDTAIAHHWLLRRMGALAMAMYEIALELDVTDDIDKLAAADLAIVHGDGKAPGRHATSLFTEEIFPVCAPEYLERHGPIDTLEDLAQADLIELKYQRWAWANWTIWLTEMGAPEASLHRAFQSDLYTATIEAASAGLGVALGWRHLVDDEVLAGRLCTPLQQSLTTGRGYHLVASPELADTRPVRILRQWLLAEINVQPLCVRPGG